ncbi:chloride channel protein [Sphingobacterium faecale]|uniref:Chloride channel protein n=1 Tax=Sphingobacterium faecale TaxID=2803775 RepID=A0ABS1R6A3_9SPHI|nr:chloride channel protein [Sphingobacterium faecale]MBL1410241.1 chloride channel protein [Sphingobacterium faecale]
MLKQQTFRKRVIRYNYFKLFLSVVLVSLISCILAFSLKHLTEFFQHYIYHYIQGQQVALFILLPSIGITSIYFLRKYVFQNRKNKGIKEIYTTLETRKDHLPFFKIPSHFINGFLTVIFGGSTGVEVSTVVATATVGNQAYKRVHSAWAFKTELICAAVTAGVTVLFGSGIGGLLFAFEVIARRFSKTLLFSGMVSMILAYAFVYFFDSKPILPFEVTHWNLSALPYIFLLAILGGILALYFTKLVIYAKHYFGAIKSNFIRVNLGAITVGALIFFLPQLYGDSYAGLHELLTWGQLHPMSQLTWLPLLLLLFLKPLAASLTLGAGGDGGVFAPSIVAGAFLGMLFAQLCNHWFGTELILLNFALFGAVAMLSAAIHAPFAALFIIMSVVPNGLQLFIPLLIASIIAKIFAKWVYPYNVYTHKEEHSLSLPTAFPQKQ